MNSIQKYWLVLYSYSFLWKEKDQGIIYNSKNFKSITFSITENINKLLMLLSNIDNLYSVEITQLDIIESDMQNLITQILSIKAGKLVKQEPNKIKPISFFPLLKIETDYNQIIREINENEYINFLSYLSEVTFYINGSANGNNKYYKQIPWPLKSKDSLSIETIKKYINLLSNRENIIINIIGDIFNYKDYKTLINIIKKKSLHVKLMILDKDIISNIEDFIKTDFDKIEITVLCEDILQFFNIEKLKSTHKFNINYLFTVTSEIKLRQILKVIDETNLKKYTIMPLFNGNNISFFKRNVYTDIEDLKNIKLSKREIFLNQAINVFNFGKLAFLTNGKIYANVNHESIGSINENIISVIFKEITDGTSWRMVRDKEPCCDCIYQWLCPSPSNYELVINKLNLCLYK